MFSSFTYLIDLSNIIGLIVALGTDLSGPFEPDVISADAALMNWTLYLPKQKQLITEDSGKVDEILFQAHMLFNTWASPLPCIPSPRQMELTEWVVLKSTSTAPGHS